MKTIKNQKTLKMVQLGLFTAIILLMAFTPLGYIKTAGLEITLLVVPVAVGAIVLGPVAGAVLGGIFGLTSFAQCFGASPFGAVLLGINPIGTFIVCVVTRTLMGGLTGLIFLGMKKWRAARAISHPIASLVGPLLNTFFFMTALIIFFYNTEFLQGIAESLGTKNVFAFVLAFVGINGLVEAIACFILGTAISKALDLLAQKTGAHA
jgi:uncharacterized membrane protein